MDNLLMIQQDKGDNDGYIIINKKDIDKVYGIIMDLPNE